MRIAMIGQKGIPAIYGGIERHVEDLSRELVKQGHDILVYARSWYTAKALKNYHGVKITHTWALHSKHFDAITHTFTATLNAIHQKSDIIHYHGVGPALLAWIPRVFSPRTKVIVTFHCIDRYHQKWGIFAKLILWLGEKAACTFAHETISVSKTIQNYCLNEYHKKTTYIPNGVSVSKSVGENLIEKWNLQKNKYILMVSRLVPHKGAHYLLEAWQMARQQYPQLLNGYQLVIVGGSTFTDDYLDELHYIARGDKSITFTGWQHGQVLEELYANCALYINPSENEGMPITVLQAMAYGRPVLLSNIPEHQELITDTNFLFHNTSIVSLADKIIKLIKDEKNLQKSGEANKLMVKKQFNWNDLGKQTMIVYTDNKKKLTHFKTARA